MPPRTRSALKGTESRGSNSEDHPIDAELATDTIYWPWSSYDPIEKLVLETVTNANYSRLRTPSPKLSSKLVSPPKVDRRPRHDRHRHRLSNYSSDFDIPAEEAQRIRESSRENGSILFEHFNQKYVPQEKSSPCNSPAIRNARQVLDSPFQGAPLASPGIQVVQSGGLVLPKDATLSEGKTFGISGRIQTKNTD
ncbi:hypothetical protein CVT25_008156 [Psilocybe cyanescens]|uniref:Uncharacterized protein n=1 Tax=Psilocybe cyanescens TaxID=93625 RepID=A0A409XSU3_PSICY|nr:hypothetical protein CVT25_008156 [Psilocybe cyanescens]